MLMKYIPNDVTDFDNIMSPMRWDSEENEAIESFVEYYEENCGKPYAIVDEKNISLVWEDPENSTKKHTCVINPSTKAVTFQPLAGKSSKIKISEQLLSDIEDITNSWALTVTPFKHKKEKKTADKNKPLEIPMVMVVGNPEAKPVSMPNNLVLILTWNNGEGCMKITANYHTKKGVYGGNNYKKRFATAEESVIDVIKVALNANCTPGMEVSEMYDGFDDSKKYTIGDMEQLVFQYIQKQSPVDTNILLLPVYDPSEDKQMIDFIEAIKRGELDLVRQFLLSGAHPTDDLKTKKSGRINPFDTAIKAKQKEVALALLEHRKALGEEVPEWMYAEIDSIK